jgi:hypothetical protein
VLERYLGIVVHLILALLSLWNVKRYEGETYLELDGDRLRLLPLLGALGIVNWNRKWKDGNFRRYLVILMFVRSLLVRFILLVSQNEREGGEKEETYNSSKHSQPTMNFLTDSLIQSHPFPIFVGLKVTEQVWTR